MPWQARSNLELAFALEIVCENEDKYLLEADIIHFMSRF